MKILQTAFVSLVFLFPLASATAAQENVSTEKEKIASLNSEITRSEALVKLVVNRPVMGYRIGPGSTPKMISPGWFDNHTDKPDYNGVDVRTTRELPYEKIPFVTSPTTPGFMFPGVDLEYNPELKYYYSDLNVPKKKLTDEEMVSINNLYHVIGMDKKKLADLEGSWNVFSLGFFNSRRGTAVELILLVLVGTILYRILFKPKKA